jgi:predicted membrane channel-forming protein YqfA (hemolysin III family)
MLADTTWDFGDFMLGVLWIFFFIIWVWLLITVFSDIFRRHDIGGGMKTLWVLFVLFFPYLGAFIYLISQGRGLAERNQQMQQAAVEQMRQQIGYSAADELQKLDALHSQGKLSDEEYQQLRAKTLA